jgi:AcrR family transcriptional regulator
MAGGRNTKQDRARRTREQLLRSARRVFGRASYAGATIEDITNDAGVSKGSFYFHFASKEDVLVALVRQWAADLRASQAGTALAGAASGGDVRIALGRLLGDGEAAWEPRLLLEFVAQAEQSTAVAQELARAQTEWQGATARLLARARRGGVIDDGLSPGSLAAALLALRNGLIIQDSLPGANRRANASAARKAAGALLGRGAKSRKAS